MSIAEEEYIQLLAKLSKGNPGALKVLRDPMADRLAIMDLGITGPGIWLAYKDYAQMNIVRMNEGIRERDPKLLDILDHYRERYIKT